MKLIFFLMGCYGITTLIVQSKIMEPLRNYFKVKKSYLYKLITCMMCTGFWVSIISSFSLQYSISYNIFADGNFINVFDFFFYLIFDASFISGMIFLIYLIQLNLERYVKDEI
jgi:hypothetical protein